MPWKRAKALPPPYLGIELFNAQFRIQREAIEAAGHYIPMVVENVRGAQKWVGQARYHYGSFHLWGDVPALMPTTTHVKVGGTNISKVGFNVAAVRKMLHGDPNMTCAEGRKHDGSGWTEKGSLVSHNRLVSNQGPRSSDGTKFSQSGAAWFDGKPRDKMLGNQVPAAFGSKSNARKAASALIAKIPFPLSSHIARCFKPIEDMQ
jgi:hypothetical protein